MSDNYLPLILLLPVMSYLYFLDKRNSQLNDQRTSKLHAMKTIIHTHPKQTVKDRIETRDRDVVRDPLYPPIDRMPRPIADDYLIYKDNIFGASTRQNSDTYRLMGYMVNSVDRNDKWNLYGRQKYRGSSQGDFYAIQQCSSTSQCTKIDLDRDIFVGKRIDDFYNLPKEVTLNSPLFSASPYNIVQLKSNLDYGPYY